MDDAWPREYQPRKDRILHCTVLAVSANPTSVGSGEPDPFASEGNTMITQQRLKELLHYNPETGIFTWKVSRGRAKCGSVAGTLCRDAKCSRVKIRLLGKQRMAHRLAWLYMTGLDPVTEIDHKDRNPLNNSFDNLRDVTHKENLENTGVRSDNTSGFKGVSWNSEDGKWAGKIQHIGKTIFIGNFNTPEEASEAVEAMRDKLFTHHQRKAA